MQASIKSHKTIDF